MKTLRLLLLFLVLSGISVGAYAQVPRGEKSLGVRAGYVTQNQSGTAGLFFQYTFGGHFRLAPDLGLVFRHHDRDAFTANVNAQIPFGFQENKVALYPLGGLAFASWGEHDYTASPSDPWNNDVTTHINRLGANLGGGVELRCGGALKLNVEAKYVFIRHYSGTELSMGICYVF